MKRRQWKSGTALGALIIMSAIAAGARAADETPQTTPEGMELRQQTKSRIVYAMPGATLAEYTKVALLDCYVAFAKNWDRDYNRNVQLQNRVNASDMERIKTAVADEFRKIFTEELEKAGHEVVDYAGDEVLVLRPAIVNLEVTAPNVRSAAMSRTFVTSAGQMTLFLELYDSATGAIIARIMDAEVADRGGMGFEANRVTNRAEADRVLRSWAKELSGHLGEVDLED